MFSLLQVFKLFRTDYQNILSKETIECGDACGAMAVAGAVLTIVALSNPITGLVGGLAAAFGASFSIAGIGCAFA